ncbi:transporter substrate-binding domain-containing protein [Rubrobacter tropicus]|uniref:Transporter substrate-binding domain-containing protein n=1 Tax=Rubrobacter tropicus TaxID=2653851 RepID=A0A6G8QBB9_9ACTN|nr:transporter substrate-binding domain-containing protein [Rubrobacter tropicus]QIN83780.1 transporter substrate-binding domain-containing protein [Rubrobacter tropicus]
MRGFVLAGWICLAALVAISSGGCGFPRDPMGTLERVRGGQMRVGVVANEPWTRANGEPSGVEVELIEDFAGELRAETVHVRGTTPELLQAARQGEVDVVVGGFTDESPGIREQKEAGITRPYLVTRPVVGVPPGEEEPEDLAGLEVAVGEVDANAAHLKEQGAVPVRVDDPSEAGLPVAAYGWQLEAWGFEPTGLDLPEERHVVAVPLGENGWLLRLERFLQAHRGDAERLLRQGASG